jgi:hypothetical protein
MKQITAKWLTRMNACCSEEDKQEAERIGDPRILVEKLIEAGRRPDAIWLVTRMLPREQNIKMAVYAAQSVLYLFENVYPYDDRPRKAIECAIEGKDHTDAAADRAAAYAAAYAATAAYAAFTAHGTVGQSVAFAAAAAASAAARASYAANHGYVNKVREILSYGLELAEKNGDSD